MKLMIAAIILASATAAQATPVGTYVCVGMMKTEIAWTGPKTKWRAVNSPSPNTEYQIQVNPTSNENQYYIGIQEKGLDKTACVDPNMIDIAVTLHKRQGFICNILPKQVRFNPEKEVIEIYSAGDFSMKENEEDADYKRSSSIETGVCVNVGKLMEEQEQKDKKN